MTQAIPPLLQARLDVLRAESKLLQLLIDDPGTSDNAWFEQADRVAECLQAVEATAQQEKEATSR